MTQENACCGDLSKWLSPRLFRALGDPCRAAILANLAECAGEKTVSEVAECCPVDISVVSRHLRILLDAGIVGADKRGRKVFYKVRIGALVQMLRSLADALEGCCPDGSCEPIGSEDVT